MNNDELDLRRAYDDLRALVPDGLPDHARLETDRDIARRRYILVVRVGGAVDGIEIADHEVESAVVGALSNVDVVAAIPRLAKWFAGLPHRFRASWARPGEVWPDCLPPMFPGAWSRHEGRP